MSTNQKYSILVKTGSIEYAGTSAMVYIKLYGENGDTERIHLNNKDKDDFENDNSDGFTITAENIGAITDIEMCHDNKPKRSGWFLDFVIVVDLETKKTYKADFNCWLRDSDLSKKVTVNSMNAVCL